jgi:hypothetical protein
MLGCIAARLVLTDEADSFVFVEYENRSAQNSKKHKETI